MICFVDLVWQVKFGRFCLVGFVWFGLFEVIFLRLRPLKVVKASQELHFRTILGGLGQIVIIRLTQPELGLAIF